MLYVEIPLSPANLLKEWKTTLAHWHNWKQGEREVRENLFVYSGPPVFPLGRSWVSILRINQRLLFSGVKKMMAKLGFSQSLVWISDPYFSALPRNFSSPLTIFDWIHETPLRTTTRRGRVYRIMEEDIRQKAQVIITPSRVIYERHGQDDPRFILVPNGVDLALFQNSGKEVERPPDLTSLPAPVIGFIGTIGPAVDLELLEFLARKKREWSFVFIGAVRRGVEALRSHSNVYFLGPRAREELPRYLGGFSVGIIPYILSPETETVHPVKTYEYLAAGLPVVSMNLPELKHLEGIVELAGSFNDFLHRLEKVINEDSPEQRERRRQVAREHSWERRMQVIQEVIEVNLKQR